MVLFQWTLQSVRKQLNIRVAQTERLLAMLISYSSQISTQEISATKQWYILQIWLTVTLLQVQLLLLFLLHVQTLLKFRLTHLLSVQLFRLG